MSAASRRRRRLRAVPAAAAALLLLSVGAASPGDSSPDGRIVYPSAVGVVTFPHGLHAEELGFDCAECHHETAAARLQTPHDDYFEDLWHECAICHREAEATVPQSCGGCHHDSPTSTADETLSAKVVIHRSCWSCHESGTGREASRSCGFCHAALAPLEEASR